MQYRRIDAITGNFIEDVFSDSPSPGLIAVPCPAGFILPRWDGERWVEGGIAPPPTEAELEAQYKARVAELIHEAYSIDREAGLVGETLKAISEGLPASEEFLTYRAYVEQCKDKAYAEAYGRARE